VLESVTLASRTLEVSGTAPLVTLEGGVTSWHSRLDRALSFAREHRLALLLAASCLVLGVAGVRRLLPPLLALRALRREQYGGSEAKLFQDLEQSAAQGDIDALVRNFWRWRDRLVADLPSLTEEILRRAAETSGFADRWAELEQRRYGGGPSAGALGSLRPALRALRDAVRSASRPRGAASVTAGLNPRGERD
jgi:hypothetical protein